MTLQAMRHVAKMRSNLKLLAASKIVDDDVVTDIFNDTLHNLELGNLNYPPLMRLAGLDPEMTYNEKRDFLDLGPAKVLEPHEKEILEPFEQFMLKSGDDKRKSEWLWRVGAAAAHYQQLGWYPFFVTLTVDQTKYNARDIWKEGKAFRQYKRDLNLLVTKKLGHRPSHKSNVPTSEYMAYFGVIEHGESRTHDHMHLLLWLRDVPEYWKRCPNRYIRDPNRRTHNRCKPLETLWPYAKDGFKPALYFRSDNDMWKKHGFCEPIMKKTGRPLETAPPEKAGTYLAKYMGKDEKEWKHRVRATRNLGKELLQTRLQKMSTKRLEALSWRSPQYHLNLTVQTIHNVPLPLIRSMAQREIWLRKYSAKELTFAQELRKNSNAYMRMRESVLAGAKPHRMPSQERYDWVTEHLPAINEFSEQRFKNAHRGLQYLFPVPPPIKIRRMGVNT